MVIKMIDKLNENQCSGCECCKNICPTKSIHMIEKNGFYFPKIQYKTCISCNLCEERCPSLNKINTERSIKACYVGYYTKPARENSTSGGAFYAFANYVLTDKKGVVYGAAFNPNFEVTHIRVDNIEDLHKLQGSKYPQSRINDVFISVKNNLLSNKFVLFSGTPCQVNGLNNFLGKKYNNLLTIDIICQGVASPSIWFKYVNCKFPNEKVLNIVFKDKKNGWKRWSVVIKTEISNYEAERTADSYMCSYLNGYNVRSSCFDCKAKGIKNRTSDITIADAWGIPENDIELNDGHGLSSIIIYTESANQVFLNLKDDFVFKEYSFDDIIYGNKSYNECIKPNIFRKRFIKRITRKNDTIKCLDSYSNKKIIGKLLNKLNNIMK